MIKNTRFSLKICLEKIQGHLRQVYLRAKPEHSDAAPQDAEVHILGPDFYGLGLHPNVWRFTTICYAN